MMIQKRRQRTWPRLLLGLVLLAGSLGACGAASSGPTPTLEPQAAAGKALFDRECVSCHSLRPDVTLTGPSLAGVAARAGGRVPGLDAEAYLMMAIVRPADYQVEGFQDLMPRDLGRRLTAEQLQALVAFLMTLR